MERRIRQVVLPFHPLLGRNVNHDSASRAYAVRPARADVITAMRHESHIAVLDQGQLGSCTGNAGVSAMYHHPYVTGVVKPWPGYPGTEDGAVNLYSAASRVDPYAGSYPPDDTGSDGLSVAKVLKAAGDISGYLWAFTLAEALAQLAETPVITGVPWLNSMFDTTAAGHAGHVVIRQDSGIAGGHELCADELILPGGATIMPVADVLAQADQVFVGGPNSWSSTWGDGGRWYWTAAEWGWLLAQQGDVTAFVPATSPAPEPTPTPAPDEHAAGELLASARMNRWARADHVGENAYAARQYRSWARATGRT